tara:strand:- start:828 stop:971 length:144 start_codon:yes stop_codon:yes gene_type:complete
VKTKTIQNKINEAKQKMLESKHTSLMQFYLGYIRALEWALEKNNERG